MSDGSLLTPINQLPVNMLSSSGIRLEDKVRAAQNAAGKDQKPELKKVAQQFEAVFITQLLKVMRETIEESGLMEGGFGKSIYTEMFDQEVALNMARHGTLGISDLLCKNLSAAAQASENASGDEPATKPAAEPSILPQASPKEQGSDQKTESEITNLQLPVQAPISSAFGLRKDPFSRQTKFHKGLDLAAPEGTKVIAALPGKVLAAGYERGYGNTVVIQHADGVQTKYGHLASINVKAGDSVDSQNALGTVGSTGHSTGPHLHFEVIRMGKSIDPILSCNAAGYRLGSENTKAGS
jgi:murein DD-endopeptidase MepM/ murein hydrolase activator NlpD